MTVSFIPSSRKTETDVAEKFLSTFDLPDDDDGSTIITVDEFDQWARRCGYYDGIDIGNHDSIVAARQRVRQAINNVALGQPWRDIGERAFTVQVYRHGESYQIVTAAQGYIDSGASLPQRVQGIADTRFRQLEAFMDGADFTTMPPDLRAQARQALRNVRNWKARLALETKQLEQDFRDLRNDVREYDEGAASLIENHDVTR